MTTSLDPTILAALEAIYGALGERPAPRHYAPPPAADYHVECFRRQCERDEALRELRERNADEAERAMGGQNFDAWCEDQMGYHGDRR